jgi:hypothetical protein
MAEILLAHAPGAAKGAEQVAAALAALGYRLMESPGEKLAPRPLKSLNAAVAKAACVIVLWSKGAADAPALRVIARQAKASGKLAFARLDAAALPPGLGAGVDLSAWNGRPDARAWRRLLAQLPKTSRPASKPASARKSKASAKTSRKGSRALALIPIVLLTLIAAAAAAAIDWL